MNITLSWSSLLTASAVIGAITAIAAYFTKLVRWVDRQQKQNNEIQQLKQIHTQDVQSIMKEQTMLTYGILACLKGLQEQGCNGPVTEAVHKIEQYLNERAHE
jgi:ABC-type taurine transport system substrate-binding protein